jgi:hypothetical protein
VSEKSKKERGHFNEEKMGKNVYGFHLIGWSFSGLCRSKIR